MKKLIYTVFAAAAVLAAVSCEKEAAIDEKNNTSEETVVPESNLVNPVRIIFTADALTRVSLQGVGTEGAKTAVWDDGDVVKIIWYAGGAMGSALATAETYGSASTTFSATVEDAEYYYAVYPSTIDATLDGEGNFKVNFPAGSAASTTFGGAAWYAAKTTKASKSFAFHPISAVIKFTLDGSAVADPTQIYFRSVGGGLNRLCGEAAITFAEAAGYPVSLAPVLNGEGKSDGAGNVWFTVGGAGTYYVRIPGYGLNYTYQSAPAAEAVSDGTTGADGFILQIRKGGETIPAAYYGAEITQEAGNFYNINNPVDGKVITNYYVARTSQGSGDGLSQANAASLSDLKTNVAAFKYSDKIAGALLLDGTTINILGDASAYTEPIGVFNTNSSASSHSYTIVGGIGGGTTTFTTTAASTFDGSKATVTVRNVTFSGCSTSPAVEISKGTVNFDNVNLNGCSAKGLNITGGTFAMTGGSISDFKATQNAVVISKEPSVSFTEVTFARDTCSGQQGGAVRMQSGTNDGPVVSFTNCDFSNNGCTKSSGQGGATYIGTNSKVSFTGCSFNSNSATNGGGVMVAGSASSTDENFGVSFQNCTFQQNASTATGAVGGGAICVGTDTAGGIVTFNNCRFANDTAPQGAAYYTSSTVAALFNACTFYLEKATKTDNTGINGHTIYSNNTSGRLGLNNCTIQALNLKDGEYNAGSNGTTLRSSGYGVIANTTIWSSGATGKRALIMVGRGPSVAGSSAADNTIVNCVLHEKSDNYNALFLHANYKVQVLYSIYDGQSTDPDGTNQIITGSVNRGNKNNTGLAGGKNYTNQLMNGVGHSYYTFTFNGDTYGSFTPATKDYVNEAIENTNGIGELFHDWLEDIGALDVDIMGNPRGDTMAPGSYHQTWTPAS